MNENLIHFFKQKPDVFPLGRPIDLERFLGEAIDDAGRTLPAPAKIFLVDELEPHSYGFPVSRSQILTELEEKLDRWLEAETTARISGTASRERSEALLQNYRDQVVRLARNALASSILADYHAVFWLVHSQQVARLFTGLPRRIMSAGPTLSREAAEQMKYLVLSRWTQIIRESLPAIASTEATNSERTLRFPRLLLDNPLLTGEEHISSDLRELRAYVTGHLRRDFTASKKWFDDLRTKAAELMTSDRIFRRAMLLLGYPDAPPGLAALLDRRVQQLVQDHPTSRPLADQPQLDALSKKLLEYLVVHHLRRGIVWMKTTADGDNVSEDDRSDIAFSRALRPMDFGRRGVVEPIVYRYGLVYDITSFTQTLGEIARGGKGEEQTSYRQMLEFQRDLAEITRRNGLQFEKFLGDGAFYTSRRATRTIQAAVEIQRFYATSRAKGFAFNKGMRIALNYGYYRLLPMQVSTDGTEIKEFYGPGIVELSRLTSGKATKELEDIQHLLVSHGYDQMEVYRFFAPLSRSSDRGDAATQQREFYAYVNENGHLMNEGIVVSIPFLKQLSTELIEEHQKVYRLRASWGNYLGFPAHEPGVYLGVRLLGSVSLKGIGNVEVGEVVRISNEEAEVSMVDESKPLLHLLQLERNRSTATSVAGDEGHSSASGDLVVCESHAQTDGGRMILVGEWDPVAEEVRRPIRLDEGAAERYGLAVPLTAEVVESQSIAYQKLYRVLSRMETLPSFSVQAIRDNANFSGFIIGATVERL